MRKQEETAVKEYEQVCRVAARFFEVEQDDRESEKGKKLLKFLSKKEQDWRRLNAEQFHNTTRREISLVTAEKLERYIRE